MKIHDKLWYIINPSREENLAYMTYWEDNSACLKRMATGLSWAAGRYHSNSKTAHPDPVGVQIDNSPISGFNIGSSVCRWSTENKVFRVTDPRGFTVEVPTDNIATLLHLTDVHKGVIQQECIWARDGNNHVLLPVNSEPYLATLKEMEEISEALSVKDLQLWDRVYRLCNTWKDSLEYIYIGQYKASWHVTIIEDTYDYWSWRHSSVRAEDRYKLIKDFGVVKDHKWEHYFLVKYAKCWGVTSLGSSCKIAERVAGQDTSEVLTTVKDEESLPRYAPDRVTKKYNDHIPYRGSKQSVQAKFHGLGERRK